MDKLQERINRRMLEIKEMIELLTRYKNYPQIVQFGQYADVRLGVSLTRLEKAKAELESCEKNLGTMVTFERFVKERLDRLDKTLPGHLNDCRAIIAEINAQGLTLDEKGRPCVKVDVEIPIMSRDGDSCVVNRIKIVKLEVTADTPIYCTSGDSLVRVKMAEGWSIKDYIAHKNMFDVTQLGNETILVMRNSAIGAGVKILG